MLFIKKCVFFSLSKVSVFSYYKSIENTNSKKNLRLPNKTISFESLKQTVSLKLFNMHYAETISL